MSEFLGVVTTIGQQKIAAAIGGVALAPTIIRVGDGNGAPITPVEGMADLVRRVGNAYAITSAGRDPANAGAWRFSTVIPVGDGPFDIREIGLFDAAGDMLAIARHVYVEKRTPAQGAAVEIATDIIVPVSETAQISLNIQPDAAISIFQQLRSGFMAVESASLSAPPANPALGATYVVAAAPTGAWAGMAGRLVQWNGNVWVSVSVPVGHLVVAQDQALDAAGRWLRREAGAWVSAVASATAAGVTLLATKAKAQARTDNACAVTPLGLAGIVGAGVDFRTVINASTSAPPANPALFDAYLIAAAPAPSGAWAGHAGKLATWDGAEWIVEQLRVGARVIDRSTPVTSASRELRQASALVWSPVQATTTDFGHARRATPAEARAGAQVNAYVTPEDLVGLADVPVGALPWPEIYSADARAAISVAGSAGNGGSITVTGGELVTLGEDTGGGMGSLRRVALPAANFAGLVANSVYFVRLRLNAGAPVVYIQRGADTDVEPVGLVGAPNAATGGGFSTTRIDVLLARVMTGAAGSAPVITRLASRAVLKAVFSPTTGNIGWSMGWASGADTVTLDAGGYVVGNFQCALNWSRPPDKIIATCDVRNFTGYVFQYVSGISNAASAVNVTRYGFTLRAENDWVDSQILISGTLQITGWGVSARALVEA